LYARSAKCGPNQWYGSDTCDPIETEFHFENTITRIEEKPRVTKPFSDEQWEDIMALGDKVDEEFAANNVRLTMGGEPTFVSVDNNEAPEWNSAADGEHKRRLSNILFHKLKNEYGEGALMQYGQGKWYPGEPLPRWKLACYWRKDHVPLWNNDTLMADMSKDYGLGPKDAKSFMRCLPKSCTSIPKNIAPHLRGSVLLFVGRE
jgi:uncharacterized protein (DUF2126 family)